MKEKPVPRRVLKLTRGFQIEVLFFILLVVAMSVASSMVLVYFISSQELSRSFFSAHRDLQNLWKLLVPATLIIGGGVGLLASLTAFLGLWRFKRLLERKGRALLEDLERMGRGDLKGTASAGSAAHLKPVAEAVGTVLGSLQQHLREVKTIEQDLQRATKDLNYRVVEEGEITLKEIRTLSANLNALSRELNTALKWFEV